MDGPDGGGTEFADVDPCRSEELDLFPELRKIRPPLVVDVGFGNEHTVQSMLNEAHGEFNVLPLYADSIPPAHLPRPAGDSHVERTGVVLPYVSGAAPDAPRGQGRRHRMADRFLQWCERRMRCIGSPVHLDFGVGAQVRFHHLEVGLGYEAV